MIRTFCKKNFGNLKKFITQFSEVPENNAATDLSKKIVLKKIECSTFLPINKLIKENTRNNFNSIYFLCANKKLMLGAFLNPDLNLKPKALLWNSVKRQLSHEYMIPNNQKAIDSKNRFKLAKVAKRLRNSPSTENLEENNNFMVRLDDIYLDKIENHEAVEEESDISTSVMNKRNHKNNVISQTVKDWGSYSYKTITAPVASFSEYQQYLTKISKDLPKTLKTDRFKKMSQLFKVQRRNRFY